jgi:hypothetical protein
VALFYGRHLGIRTIHIKVFSSADKKAKSLDLAFYINR